MLHRFTGLATALLGLALLGCQATTSTPPSDSRPRAMTPEEKAASPLVDPGSHYRRELFRIAMRGLKYDNETVTIDTKVAATVAQRGTRAEALAVAQQGQAAYDQNDLVSAITGFTKAVIIDPSAPTTYDGLGVALLARGKTAESLACFRKALELDANYIDARLHLADCLARAGRLDDAIVQWRTVLAQDPNEPEAHGRLAIALYYAEDDAGAWQHLRAAEALGYEMPAQFRDLLAARSPE